MDRIWRHALSSLENGREATLVTLVENTGSVPGKVGSKLVATGDGVQGTIGGGKTEKMLSDRVSEGVEEPELVHVEQQVVDSESKFSGSQIFAIVPLAPRDAEVVAAIAETLAKPHFGALEISPEGISFRAGGLVGRSFERERDRWRFVETIGPVDTLTIVGGGHVCLALSRIMSTLPFRIVVLDDRRDLPTMDQNGYAHEKRVISYDSVLDHVPQGDRCYAVIMTHAHAADEQVLEQLLKGSFKYLGMMGSAVKVDEIFFRLEEKGATEEQLAAVYSPIGLPIGSHSPEEIAISIAAEIVMVRNGRSPGALKA